MCCCWCGKTKTTKSCQESADPECVNRSGVRATRVTRAKRMRMWNGQWRRTAARTSSSTQTRRWGALQCTVGTGCRLIAPHTPCPCVNLELRTECSNQASYTVQYVSVYTVFTAHRTLTSDILILHSVCGLCCVSLRTSTSCSLGSRFVQGLCALTNAILPPCGHTSTG